MSKIDFDAMSNAIMATPDKDTKSPKMPVGEAVQEAENLVAWCKDDKARLTKAELDWQLVEGLTARAGACRYAQSIWARESKSQEEAQKEWKIKSPAAFNLRDELVHHFLYGFRKHPDLVSKVHIIREGGSNADMLQDLSDLSVLGKDNIELLKKIGVDTKLLTEAAQQSDDLAVVLALANSEAGDDSNPKEVRDKAYTYMKQAVDEIRETGQYLFWRDKDRKKGYVSAYRKKGRKKGKTSTGEE